MPQINIQAARLHTTVQDSLNTVLRYKIKFCIQVSGMLLKPTALIHNEHETSQSRKDSHIPLNKYDTLSKSHLVASQKHHHCLNVCVCGSQSY